MARGLSASLISAITSNHCHLVTFASLAFSSGTVRVHDDIGTITWGSNDWLGVGSFGRVQTVEEGDTLTPYGIELYLTGVDPDDIGEPTWPDFLDEMLNNDYYEREVILYIGARDTHTMEMAADPDELWRGVMQASAVSLGAGEGDGISLTCESELAKMERSANLLYTDQELQSRHSGDLFFQFLSKINDLQPVWRGTNRSSSGTSAATVRDVADRVIRAL